MADATARDEGLGNLEAFLTLLQATRDQLGELEAALEGRSTGLNDEAVLVASRGDALSQALSSLAGGLALAQQEAAAELGGLGQAALATVESRLGAVRSSLDLSGAGLRAGLVKAQDQLDTGSEEVEGSLSPRSRCSSRAARSSACAPHRPGSTAKAAPATATCRRAS